MFSVLAASIEAPGAPGIAEPENFSAEGIPAAGARQDNGIPILPSPIVTGEIYRWKRMIKRHIGEPCPVTGMRKGRGEGGGAGRVG